MEYYFEIKLGFYNAWLGMVILWLSGAGIMFFDKKTLKRLTDTSWYSKKDRFWLKLSQVLMYGVIIISLCIPLKIGTLWFYSGLVIWLAGIVGQFLALYNYASTPLNQPVVGGMYKYSRNPIYFFYSLATFGVCVASASIPLIAAW